MDTKDTVEKTAPSVAPTKPAPAPKPAAEPETEEPVASVPLRGLGDDSLEGLGAAFSGRSVGGPEGKEKEKEKEAVDMGVGEEDPGDGHEPFDEVPQQKRPVESPNPQYPLQQPLHSQPHNPATSSPTTTPPMAEGPGFTGMPYPTYGVTLAATAPHMASAVS